MPNITFVDENDQVIGYGTMEKALSKGMVRRIVRLFVSNSKGELLIQKRSANVAVPGKWDQSAGGHVDEGEDYDTAAKRELLEEVGISNVTIKKLIKYYSEETEEPMLKRLFNTLYSATYDGEVKINEEEVATIKWIKTEELEKWMKDQPNDFTQGFIQGYDLFKNRAS